MTAVEVNAGGAVVKLRRPWVVGARSLISWIVSVWRSVTRIEACERLDGSRPETSAPVLSLLIGASLVSWVGVFAGQGPVAVPPACALMKRRLTRLWVGLER